MTVKLRLPPGFFNNGTEYEAVGRWHRGNLVRWVKNMLLPINGWRRKSDLNTETEIAQLWLTADEAPRGGIAYTKNEFSAVDICIGTNRAVYTVTPDGTVTETTPSSFSPQVKDAAAAVGYNTLSYGFVEYGVERPGSTERVEPAFTWGFTNWGFWPVAVARGFADNVYIKTDTDLTFVPISNSPIGALDALVTDERFLMTFGKTTDHLLIEWSDRENYDMWTPLPENEAGSQRVSGRGKLLRGVTTQNRILILGEVDAFVGQYLGPPYVYGFDRVAEGCGLIAANAVAATEDFTIWLGRECFWIYDGKVRELPCEVFDYFRQDVETAQISKIVAFTLSRYAEIWFLYQSKSSPTSEADSYLVYNHNLQVWYFGKLSRSFGMDSGVMRYPMMVTPDGYLYDHEVRGLDREGFAWAESGPLEAENGARMIGCSWLYPDVHPSGAISARLSVRDMPELPVRYYRDFALTSPTSTMGIMGRSISLRLVETGTEHDWRVGDMRFVPVLTAGPRR